jgi:hypothetical protein
MTPEIADTLPLINGEEVDSYFDEFEILSIAVSSDIANQFNDALGNFGIHKDLNDWADKQNGHWDWVNAEKISFHH